MRSLPTLDPYILLVSYRRVSGSIPSRGSIDFSLSFSPLLFHSNFQSLQMRSLPTLDPYIFLIFIRKMSLLDLFLSGNCFLIFRVLWWGHKRGFKIMGTWCSRSTWACNATQYVAILVNHWTSASDTMVIFLPTFLGWFPLVAVNLESRKFLERIFFMDSLLSVVKKKNHYAKCCSVATM